MKKLFYYTPIALTIILTGCAHISSTQTSRTFDTNGKIQSEKTTHAFAISFFDSNDAIAKYHADQTGTNQSTYVGGLTESATGTNAVALGQSLITAGISVLSKAP